MTIDLLEGLVLLAIKYFLYITVLKILKKLLRGESRICLLKILNIRIRVCVYV